MHHGPDMRTCYGEHMTRPAPVWIVALTALMLLVAVVAIGNRLSAVEQHNACVTEYLADPPGLFRGHKCLAP